MSSADFTIITLSLNIVVEYKQIGYSTFEFYIETELCVYISRRYNQHDNWMKFYTILLKFLNDKV